MGLREVLWRQTHTGQPNLASKGERLQKKSALFSRWKFVRLLVAAIWKNIQYLTVNLIFIMVNLQLQLCMEVRKCQIEK